MHIEQGKFLSVSQKKEIILFGCLLQFIYFDISSDEYLLKLDFFLLLFWMYGDLIKLLFFLVG